MAGSCISSPEVDGGAEDEDVVPELNPVDCNTWDSSAVLRLDPAWSMGLCSEEEMEGAALDVSETVAVAVELSAAEVVADAVAMETE